MQADVSKIASHTIDGVTFSVKYICKWISFEPHPRWAVACHPDGMVEVRQPGEWLVVSLMLDPQNDAIEVGDLHSRFIFEDNLGNQTYDQYVSGRHEEDGRRLYGTVTVMMSSISTKMPAIRSCSTTCRLTPKAFLSHSTVTRLPTTASMKLIPPIVPKSSLRSINHERFVMWALPK